MASPPCAAGLALPSMASVGAQGGEAITWVSIQPMATSCICPTLNNTGHGGELCNSAEAAALPGSVVNTPVMSSRNASPERITLWSSKTGNNTADSLVQVVSNTAADMKQAGQSKTLPGVSSGGG